MILLPKENKFFDLYDELADILWQAIRLARVVTTDYDQMSNVATDMKILENDADDVCHKVIHSLSLEHIKVTETLADIRHFVHKLDNVIDCLESAVFRLDAYKIQPLPEVMYRFFDIIYETAHEIKMAVMHLRNLKKKSASIEECVVRINDLENDADKIYREWETEIMLSDMSDREVMKLRKIVDALEKTMDEAEDVANILGTFVLKGEI